MSEVLQAFLHCSVIYPVVEPFPVHQGLQYLCLAVHIFGGVQLVEQLSSWLTAKHLRKYFHKETNTCITFLESVPKPCISCTNVTYRPISVGMKGLTVCLAHWHYKWTAHIRTGRFKDDSCKIWFAPILWFLRLTLEIKHTKRNPKHLLIAGSRT